MLSHILGAFSLVLATTVGGTQSPERTVYKRVNCQQDFGNAISNTCACDVTADGVVSGTLLIDCDRLACEEFDVNHSPNNCEPGTRGVTCWLTNSVYLNLFCPLMSPRVSAEYSASSYCAAATADLAYKGIESAYYSDLDLFSCTPSNLSYPPSFGWQFTGSLQDGW